MTVGIVCDGGASLPPDVRDAVTVVPLQREEADAGGAPADAGTRPGTAAPAPGAFLAAIEAADRGNGVLVLTVAARLSAAFAAACVAAESARASGRRVDVLDSGTATAGQGLVAQAAAALVGAGQPLDRVVAGVADVAGRVRLVAVVAQLDALVRSGRVPGVVATTARAGVCPLFELRGGAVRHMLPALGLASAERRVAREVVREARRPGRDRLHLAALHGDDPASARRLLALVRPHVAPASSFVAELSPPMMRHTGPAVSGLAWWWEVG